MARWKWGRTAKPVLCVCSLGLAAYFSTDSLANFAAWRRSLPSGFDDALPDDALGDDPIFSSRQLSAGATDVCAKVGPMAATCAGAGTGHECKYTPANAATAEACTKTSGNTTHASAGAHGGHHKSPAFDPTVFLLMTLTCSCISMQLVDVLPEWARPPHSVALYTMGMLMEYLAVYHAAPDSEFASAVHGFSKIDPHVVFWVFLPMLLYEDAAGADWHVIKRVLLSAIILAIPGVIINTCLTAGFLNLIGVADLKPALLLGSILSATDPVAVVGALTALQAPAKLSGIISGESLLNDGSAVVLFQIFLEVASGRKEFEIGGAIIKLLRLAGGGVALGLAFAACAHVWLAKTVNFGTEMLIIVICVFSCFFVAEHAVFEMSGVLAVVTFGFFMSSVGKDDLALEKEHEHHAIVNFLAFFCNESIFVIAGVVGFGFSFESGYMGAARDWLDLFLIYIGVHGTRSITIAVCYPILHRIGYHLSFGEAVICMYGGLRGAVGLAMALIVLGDADLDDNIKHKICFHVNGIVLGTLFINGLAITPLYKALKIQSPQRAAHHKTLMKCLFSHADELIGHRIHVLHKHWLFSQCKLDIVMATVPSLGAELEHACETHHGRRKHILSSKQKVEDVMKTLLDGMKGLDLTEHTKAWDFKLKVPDIACNVFHCGSLAKQAHAEQILLLEMKEAEPEPILSSQSEPTLNVEETDAGERSIPIPVLVEQPPRTPGGTTVKASLDASMSSAHTQDSQKSRITRRDSQGFKKFRATHIFKHKTGAGESPEAISGLFMELQQALLNGKRAAYKQMRECEALDKNSYDILMSSVDFQAEAVAGDLRFYSFLKKDLPEIYLLDQMGQMKLASKVGYVFIKRKLNQTDHHVLDTFFPKIHKRSRMMQWRQVERNVKVLLAYSEVLTQNIEEMTHLKEEIFRQDESAQKVTEGLLAMMQEMLTLCKEDLLCKIMTKNPTMFRIYEHILFARLIVVQQISILKELCEEGGITEDDLQHFLTHMTGPTMKTVCRFIPSLQQLTDAGEDVSGYSSPLDTLVWFVDRLTLEPH